MDLLLDDHDYESPCVSMVCGLRQPKACIAVDTSL